MSLSKHQKAVRKRFTRRPIMARYTRIFAALDGGSTQESVLERAINLAEDNGAELLLGHVIDSVPYEANGIDFVALCDDGRRPHRGRSEGPLGQGSQLRENPSPSSLRFVPVASTTPWPSVWFSPSSPIWLSAAPVACPTSSTAPFVGSVSTFLIRNMECDVLVVKPEGK